MEQGALAGMPHSPEPPVDLVHSQVPQGWAQGGRLCTVSWPPLPERTGPSHPESAGGGGL